MTCTMFVNMRQAHVIQKCFGTCIAQQPIRRRGSVGEGAGLENFALEKSRELVMMRGDYVSRKETEELGRTETSEECRHPCR